MGNICCQTDTTDDPFTSIMPHFKDYKEAEWLEGDEKMQKWKADLLKCNSYHIQQKNLLKVNKKNNLYFPLYLNIMNKIGTLLGNGMLMGIQVVSDRYMNPIGYFLMADFKMDSLKEKEHSKIWPQIANILGNSRRAEQMVQVSITI